MQTLSSEYGVGVPTGAPTCPPNVAWTTAGLVLVTMPPPVTRQPVPGGSQPVTVQTALVVAETKPTPPAPSCGSPQIASSPVARTVLVNEPHAVGVKLLEYAAVSPGNSTIGPSKIAWLLNSSNTNTLVSATSPQLVTMPLNSIGLPMVASWHSLVTPMHGWVLNSQMALVCACTSFPGVQAMSV